MRFRRLVIPVLVFVILVGAAFTAFQVSDYAQGSAAENPDAITVDNETILQQVEMWQFVQASQEPYTTGFDENVTVYNHNDDELEEGVDYEWNATHGSIYFYDTADTSDNDPANVTYDYYENTEDVKTLGQPLQVITSFLGYSGYIGAAIGLVIMLLAFAGLVARNFADSGPGTNR